MMGRRQIWQKITLIVIVIVVGILIISFLQPTRKKAQMQTTTTSKAVSQDSGLPKQASVSDWQLILVNKQHARQSEIPFTHVTVDDKQMDKRIVAPLAAFRQAAQRAGYATTLVSAYRSIAYQTQVYDPSCSFASYNIKKKHINKNSFKKKKNKKGSRAALFLCHISNLFMFITHEYTFISERKELLRAMPFGIWSHLNTL